MIYTLILVVAGAVAALIVFNILGRYSDRINKNVRELSDNVNTITEENRAMRRLLNKIARDDVGSPSLEAQLTLDEIDSWKY